MLDALDEAYTFQLTPPHKGRQVRETVIGWTKRFQLTPPHKGRPWHRISNERKFIVSTHAPA